MITCPKCSSTNTHSFDNQPLCHPSETDIANGVPRYDNEVYMSFVCEDCGKTFDVVFDIKPKVLISKGIKQLTEEEFEALYTPQINHIVRDNTPSNIDDEEICSFGGCMYETYDEELEYLLEMAKRNRVVTIIEGEDEIGDDNEPHSVMYYSSGFHQVTNTVTW